VGLGVLVAPGLSFAREVPAALEVLEVLEVLADPVAAVAAVG